MCANPGEWAACQTLIRESFDRRMRSHFGAGGAIATKERRAISIVEVFEFRDFQIRTDCAHERAEVLVAQCYAKQYGMDAVRGAKHGKGWGDVPSPCNLRDIERYNQFAGTEEGKQRCPHCAASILCRFCPDGQNTR